MDDTDVVFDFFFPLGSEAQRQFIQNESKMR